MKGHLSQGLLGEENYQMPLQTGILGLPRQTNVAWHSDIFHTAHSSRGREATDRSKRKTQLCKCWERGEPRLWGWFGLIHKNAMACAQSYPTRSEKVQKQTCVTGDGSGQEHSELPAV